MLRLALSCFGRYFPATSQYHFSGWYLRQKPVGGSKAGGLPHPSLSPFPPLPLSIPLSFQTNQWEGRSDPVRGEVPRLPPPTNTTVPYLALPYTRG